MYVHSTSNLQKQLANLFEKKKRAVLETWACTTPRELLHSNPVLSRSCPPHKLDHNASWCDQAWKYLKSLHDATSSKRVDENESITPRGVQEFFCLVEFFSFQDKNH